MAKQAKDRDWSVEVTRAYGVVPRPRSSVCPEAWARTKRPGKWRAYYGYRYRPGMAELGTPFSAATVAAATIAHQERGGRIEAPSQMEKLAAEAEARRAGKAKPVEHKPTAALPPIEHIREWMMREREAPVAAPEPVCEPEPVPAPEPAPEPIIAPQEAAPDRMAIAAAVLRDLAAKYGPRRAHKLLAMADFVTAAAGIAA